MAAACFRATYTLDGHKKLAKNRRWLDGFVSQQGQEARLYDESGALVVTARLAGAALKEGAEFDKGQFGQHIIVIVDVPCSLEDMHGGGAAGQAGAAPAAALQAAPAGAAPTNAAAPTRAGTAGRHVSGGSGRRPTFRPPRLVPAGSAPGMSEPGPLLQPPEAAWQGHGPIAAAAVPAALPRSCPRLQPAQQARPLVQAGAAAACVRSGEGTGS